jgi:hypothetical protein
MQVRVRSSKGNISEQGKYRDKVDVISNMNDIKVYCKVLTMYDVERMILLLFLNKMLRYIQKNTKLLSLNTIY